VGVVVLLIILGVTLYHKYNQTSDKDKTTPSAAPAAPAAPAAAAPAAPAAPPTAAPPTVAPPTDAAPTAVEPFMNYIEGFIHDIFEPGRPDINDNDRNKLLPGYF
jgi:hypothetical protein